VGAYWALLAECVPEGMTVPLFRLESLRAGKDLFHREQMLLCVRDAAALFEEKARQKEIVRLSRIEEEAEYGIRRITALLEAYEEDEEFLTGFVKQYYDTMYAKKAEYGTDRTEDDLQEKLHEETERLTGLTERMTALREEAEACRENRSKKEKEILSYHAVTELNKEAEEK